MIYLMLNLNSMEGSQHLYDELRMFKFNIELRHDLAILTFKKEE